MKTQALHVRVSRASVHQCKAKLTADGQPSGYLLWMTEDRPQGSQRTNLIAEEDDLLIIWKAFKANEKEELILNTEEQVPFDLRKLKEKSLNFEITFLGEEWNRRQKPHRLRLNVESWDKLSLELIKG